MESSGGQSQHSYWPTRKWRTASPEQITIDPEQLRRVDATIRASLPNLFSFLVVRRGALVFEQYYGSHARTDAVEIRSVTKSVTAALVGAALQSGQLKSLEQPIGLFLADYLARIADPRTRAITLAQLLAMTAGFDWDDGDTIWELWASDDWVAFTLSQPLAHNPGTTFNYTSGNSQLLTAVLARATGMDVQTFALQTLFGPLGITSASWQLDPQGLPDGGAGLTMTPRDLAKLGYLYLTQGRWEGRQILPAWYVDASCRAHSSGGFPEESAYGYHWWVSDECGVPAYFAAGYGGQYVYVVPALELVMVITARPDLPPARLQDHRFLFREVVAAVDSTARSEPPS
jgi:CubicO group peptidase (beta-lactamase class C family)